jgi:DNA-binding response OmpR family regulator
MKLQSRLGPLGLHGTGRNKERIGSVKNMPIPARQRVLVVDDDVELCHLLSQYLGEQGFTVEAAHNGLVGVERALSGAHDIVLLDIMLPGIKGFEVLRRVRAQSRTPILMLTARGDDQDRILGLEMGADDYLAKPFNPRELSARIEAVLRRSTPNPTEVRVGVDKHIVSEASNCLREPGLSAEKGRNSI